MSEQTRPGYRAAYNINPNISANNSLDGDNPSGGSVQLALGDKIALLVNWQDGPRGNVDGELDPPNGAFVEDVLWAALQRLEFFNQSRYRCRENSIAISNIEKALFILKDRQLSRSDRGVEGKHEV